MEIINKITMKAIGAQPRPWSVTEPREVAHLMGVARSFKTGSTTYGLFEKFVGEFEAVNTETGECFVANNMLVPAIIESLLKDALMHAGAEAGKVGQARGEIDRDGKPADTPVEFVFSVGVKPVAKKAREEEGRGGTGYEFTVKPLRESRRSDSLAQLRAISDTARKALPAPTKEPSAQADKKGHAAAR